MCVCSVCRSSLPESFVCAYVQLLLHFDATVFPANKFVNNIENSTGPITAATTTTKGGTEIAQ